MSEFIQPSFCRRQGNRFTLVLPLAVPLSHNMISAFLIFRHYVNITCYKNLETGPTFRGAATLSFENDCSRSKDSERLRILVSITIWTIWKSRHKSSINSQDVASNETTEVLLSDRVRKSWNATRFMEGGRWLRTLGG